MLRKRKTPISLYFCFYIKKIRTGDEKIGDERSKSDCIVTEKPPEENGLGETILWEVRRSLSISPFFEIQLSIFRNNRQMNIVNTVFGSDFNEFHRKDGGDTTEKRVVIKPFHLRRWHACFTAVA